MRTRRRTPRGRTGPRSCARRRRGRRTSANASTCDLRAVRRRRSRARATTSVRAATAVGGRAGRPRRCASRPPDPPRGRVLDLVERAGPARALARPVPARRDEDDGDHDGSAVTASRTTSTTPRPGALRRGAAGASMTLTRRPARPAPRRRGGRAPDRRPARTARRARARRGSPRRRRRAAPTRGRSARLPVGQHPRQPLRAELRVEVVQRLDLEERVEHADRPPGQPLRRGERHVVG